MACTQAHTHTQGHWTVQSEALEMCVVCKFVLYLGFFSLCRLDYSTVQLMDPPWGVHKSTNGFSG